jgi:hypothetical protein
MTDRLKNHLPQELRPLNGHTIGPEEAAVGHETVTMIFDKPVRLTLEHGPAIAFPAGVHQVPLHLADHWYLKVNGARVMPADNSK